MNGSDKPRCSNCFCELSARYPCPSCGWDGARERPPAALGEFTALRGGRYILGRVLGAGGFGVTYAALDTHGGGMVAIKEYMPSAFAERRGRELASLPGRERDFAEGFARFNKEWQILSSLSNIKSIVRELGFFSENGTAYIVMERLPGEDIKVLLAKTPPRDVLPFCAFVITNIGAALKEVHNRGIIHLDVSPANIFFQSDGGLRLIDFGSAAYINEPSQDTVQLKHGYAPPELYSSTTPKGPWTDIYALGATYYTLATGRKLPPAETRLVRDELVPLRELLPDVPERISASVHRALSLDLATRYKSIPEFLDAFEGRAPGGAAPRHAPPVPDAPRYSPPPEQPRYQPPAVPRRASGADRGAEAINRFGKLLSSVTPKLAPTPSNLSAPSPALLVSSGRSGSYKISLAPEALYTVGRLTGPGLSDFAVTSDPRVSKVHTRIRFDSALRRFLVTDLSTNGTFFAGGRRLPPGEEIPAYPNDTIYLASQECTIKLLVL